MRKSSIASPMRRSSRVFVLPAESMCPQHATVATSVTRMPEGLTRFTRAANNDGHRPSGTRTSLPRLNFLTVKEMKNRNLHIAVIALFLVALSLPLLTVQAAGGQIEGRVTDPKGAAVVGAKVIATDAATNQTYTATTDAQGRYKIE